MSRLPYHKPEEQDQPMQARRNAQRTLWWGIVIFLISLLVMAVPILFPLRTLAKYIVAFGFAGLCLGVSILLNSGWDWMRNKP